MTTQVAIMQEQIRILDEENVRLQTQSDQTTDKEIKNSNASKIYINKQLLTSKHSTLNLYLGNQQGNFSWPISIALFRIFSMYSISHMSFDISSSPNQVRRLLKVRVDGKSIRIQIPRIWRNNSFVFVTKFESSHSNGNLVDLSWNCHGCMLWNLNVDTWR